MKIIPCVKTSSNLNSSVQSCKNMESSQKSVSDVDDISHAGPDKLDVYNPSRSMTSKSQLKEWLHSPILSEDITKVPGVGPKNAQLLASVGPTGETITTSYQLLGVFLYSRAQGMNSVVHCNRFYQWLKSKGIYSRINDIVQACAEKVNTMFPGIYDGECAMHLYKCYDSNLSWCKRRQNICIRATCKAVGCSDINSVVWWMWMQCFHCTGTYFTLRQCSEHHRLYVLVKLPVQLKFKWIQKFINVLKEQVIIGDSCLPVRVFATRRNILSFPVVCTFALY